MNKIIDTPNIGYTEYDPKNPFDMMESIQDSLDGLSSDEHQRYMNYLMLYEALNNFGKRMYYHMEYSRDMKQQVRDKTDKDKWVKRYVYPDYPQRVGFWLKDEEKEIIKKEHLLWLEKQHPVEMSEEEKDKSFKEALKEMTLGVIDLDKIEKGEDGEKNGNRTTTI